MIWVITALLWYEGLNTPNFTDYSAITFETKVECLDYVFWNKVELVTKLAEEKGNINGKSLQTWAFFCEKRILEEV
tara:strand:+ start:1109 stop:1336 length:228 start_codon:yes stop_codon:yes gene_type:complete